MYKLKPEALNSKIIKCFPNYAIFVELNPFKNGPARYHTSKKRE